MNGFSVNKLTKMTLAGLLFASLQAGAAGIPWVGTADYTAGVNGVGTGDVVADFHSYDLGPGAALLTNTSGGTVTAPNVGDVLQGYAQTYVGGHLNLGGTGIASPQLNTTGSGAGYELTLRTDFMETITSTTGGITYTVDSGSWEIYLDGTPDYNFATDTGFTNDNAILSGTILQGAGNATPVGPGLFGVSTIDLLVTAYDTSIFSPATIQAGTSVFTLQLGLGAPVAATSVQGIFAGAGDLILTADGNLELQAVPIPAAIWLFGFGLLGLVGIARGKKV